MFEKELGIPKVEMPPKYDSANGSVWIVAVDHGGNVSVLVKPNIHPCFFDNGDSAESMGLPPDTDEVTAGVYKWTCSFHESTDWESGIVEDGWFEVEKEELLWKV